MKKIKIIYGLICTCLLLPGCSGSEDALLLPLEVSAEVATGVTRAVTEANYDKSSFELGDEISVSLKNSVSPTTYKKGNSGWLPSSGGEGLITTGNQTYVATYPTTFSGILEDQRSMQNFWQSNQLKSEATATANKVTFSFMPVAAKITIVVSHNADNTAEWATVSGPGIRTGGSSSEDIKLLITSGDNKRMHSYIGIIYPGTGRTYKITIQDVGASGSKSYTQSTAIELKAGYNYRYNFSETNDLILTSVTVTPFQDMPEENAGSAT